MLLEILQRTTADLHMHFYTHTRSSLCDGLNFLWNRISAATVWSEAELMCVDEHLENVVVVGWIWIEEALFLVLPEAVCTFMCWSLLSESLEQKQWFSTKTYKELNTDPSSRSVLSAEIPFVFSPGLRPPLRNFYSSNIPLLSLFSLLVRSSVVSSCSQYVAGFRVQGHSFPSLKLGLFPSFPPSLDKLHTHT